MEKDYLKLDVTEPMDNAIVDAERITPADDPNLDPILPSQMTLAEEKPNKRTMSMDDALKTYRLRLDSVDTMNKIANGDITTHFWGNAAKGLGDLWAEIKVSPEKFNGAIYRAFNGYMWPDMTEDQAVRLMDATTSYVKNQENLRAIIQSSEGAEDSVVRPFFSGAGQVLCWGLVGLMTGGAGIGLMAGVQEGIELSQELAETAMEENKGTLRGYDNRGDAVYSALHGIISGYIETKLGVERLFTSSVKKQGIRKLGEQVLKSAVGEGTEEYLQETSKYLFANMAGKNKRTFWEYQRDALTNAVYGALLGGTFGGLMYYPNKLRIQKMLKSQGYTDVQAESLANDMIGTAKDSILQEVDTRAQLRDHYGEQWTNLQNKIVTALENAGWKETHPEIDLQKYAADNADDIVRPLFRFSNKYGIDTRDVLQLADINVIDNAIYLKPMNLGSPEVIADRIREKKEQVKRQTELAKTGAGNAEKKQALNIQIELLQKIYEQQTGNRLAATRRTRAAKAQQDAEILANTAPAVSEIISGIDVSQMTTGQPTAQIRQEMDGQPFIYVGDKQLPVEYKVVPMDEVIASHIGQEINVNYSLKELQNRAQRGSRTDVSILQSRAAKIQPENLGLSYNTQNGAPVINEKGEVIAGNGRYEVLRMTDEKGRARYNKYLESLGLDLTGIKDPILVRVLHGLTPEQQIAVADASNVSATSAFDNASQAVQDAKLLKGTNNVTDFLNKIPIESRQGLFLANDRVNKVALDRRYNDALMAWLLNNDTALYEELYLMGGITPKIQTALNQVTPQLMALENQYPDVGLRQDLANALKRLPSVARAQDFAFTISQVEIDDASTNLFNENALLYAMVFGKNAKTWEGTGADRLQVGLTLPEFFDAYTQAAVQNQENMGKTDLFGQPLAVERTSGDILAETLTKAFPREFEENVAKSRDMKAVFLTRAQTKPGPTQLSQIDLMDTVQPSLFGDTSTATAVNNLPWERPVNVTNPIFFNRMPDATDIEVAKKNGYDSFLLMDKKEAPTSLVLLDGSVVNLKPGAKIPSASELYKPTQLFQEQLDLANENARLDDIYPEYKGETININGKDRTVYNSEGKRIAKSAEALRNFYKWFGDSKVVDSQGRPRVMYHGSMNKFDAFRKPAEDDGIYFGPISEAAGYGKELYAVYLSIQNPRSATYSEETETIPEMKKNGFDGMFINDMDYYIAFEPTQIKSTENRGTYDAKTPNILFQSGYASMRGDLIGGALDADAFEGKGEGTSVWAWGNYLLKSRELDKAHYFDSFNRQGAPRILYDGHKISDMFMTDYAQTEVIRGLIDEKSKEEILAELEKTLNARKNEVERKTDYVYNRLENKIPRHKLSEIIQDVYKLIDMGGVFYTKYPEGSIAADIQKKYKPQGENPEGKRFTEEFLSVVDAVALSYGGLDNANILRDSIKDLTVDIDIFKGMDFKKLSGLTGFTYKGRPIVKPIREQIAKHLDPTGRSYLVSEVEKQASEVLRDAVIKNTDVGEALAKAADEAEKNLMADAEKYKKRLLDTNDFTKEQKKVLDDIFAEITLGGSMALDDKSRLKIHKIADGKYTFNDQGKESWKINADLYNKFGFAFKSFESGAQKAKALREVANFFKNAKQKDFVLKSRASMYRFDVPSDRYLLDFTKTIENQSKYVINALNKLYNETHMGDRPSLRIVKSKNLEALPRYRRPQDITDNPNYDHIYNTVLDYDKELDAFILDWNDKGLKYAKNKLDSEIDRDERTIQVFKDTLKEKQEDLAKEEKYSDEYLRIEKAIASAENNISNLEERLEPKKAVKRNADKIPDNAKFSDYAEVEYEPDYHMKGYEYYQSIENSFRIGQEEEKKLAKSLGAIDKHGNIHAQKAASKLLEKYGLKGVKYYGNRDKTGFVTFGRTEPIERLLQGRAVNGFYDPELEVIVLGRNSNTGTLPHEMAHFWANTIFNLVKSGKYNNNTEFMAQAMGMFNMLGVGLNQDALTRDQQEQFATMTESVIFGMAPIPQGTELPMTAFLNWVPSKYKSILDIGYRDSTGRIVNPILDKQAVDWFNAWYANGTLPAIEMSPLEAQNTNDEQDNRIIPSSAEVMKVRATEMKAEADDLKRAREEQVREITEATATSERAAAAGASVLIESQPGNIELSTPPEEKKRTITSFLIPGRGTNTREGMFAAARDYIAANREHAEEVAFGHPNEVMNDTGVDRAILIRALMEEYDRSDPKYAELYHNLAETVSLAGKTPGLSNDMNFQFYLSAVKQITDGMEAIAAIKYAGTRNLDKARRTFNSDIDAFIQENADKIMAANAENKDILVKKMFAEAAVKFKGDESALLAQEELRRVRSLKTKEAFIDWAGREIRKMLKATPDAAMINKIMEESEKAQKAVKYLDSEDYAELEAGGKAIRGWQLAVKEEQVPETWYSKLIGSWYPKAMLYNINTHTVNIGGNLINYGIVKKAVAAQYKEGNKVPERVLKQERDRLRALYNSSLISVAAMRNPTSPTLLHGEQYNPREGKSTIGKIADFSMDLLGKEDNWFRTMAYVDALGYIATADAKKTGQSPTDLFREYKKLNQIKGTRAYEARQEALNIADIAVFQQNGTLARNLKKVRDALNMGQTAGLGTLLGPFVKTPANIVEMGARAIAAPVTSTYHAVKGDWSIQDTISTGYFVLACILLAGMMADYEPPYEVPHRYDPNKPYDSIRIRGTDMWIKLDTFAAASIPMRIIASIVTGKGLGLSGSMNEVPLLGDIADTWKETEGIERDPWQQGFRFGANVAYNRVNTAVPAILKYTLAAAHIADADLEQIETGLPKTGIGRKIGRQYGLDGGETTTNDILRIFFNRLKIAAE